MYEEITLWSQSIILFNGMKPDEEYGTIEVKKVAVIEDSVLNVSIQQKWHWIAGIYLMDGGGWKFEKTLAANKLSRIMSLNSYFSEITILNHTRWKQDTEPFFPWWMEGDNSGGSGKLEPGGSIVDFRIKLKK